MGRCSTLWIASYISCLWLSISLKSELGDNSFVKKLIELSISISHVKCPVFFQKLNVKLQKS